MNELRLKVYQSVDLTAEDVQRVVQHWLQKHIAGRWITDGKVFEERYGSHRYDEELGKADAPVFTKLVAAIEIQKIAKDAGLL